MKRQNKTLVVRLSLNEDQAVLLRCIAKDCRLSISEVVSFCMSNELADFAAKQEAVKEVNG